MENWNGKERRRQSGDMDQIKQDISDVRTDIRLLVNKVDANHESLRKTITKIEELTEKHNRTLYGNGTEGITTRVSRIGDLKADLKTHIDDDRKAYIAFATVLVTILIGIGKLVFFK